MAEEGGLKKPVLAIEKGGKVLHVGVLLKGCLLKRGGGLVFINLGRLEKDSRLLGGGELTLSMSDLRKKRW